jgi:type II secretory pathway predicted ATPase ExeA
MYVKHFGFRQRPFRSAPDSACYYPATSHEAALARLQHALADDEGLVLLTGEPGTGKTLLCHGLLERLGPDVPSTFLTNSHVANRHGLLQALLYDLSLPYEGRSEQELRLALTDLLLKNYAAGKRTLVIVDEAQHLPGEALEELRLLGNLEGRQGKAIQVVLAAQPALLDTLRRPELASFSQRLAVRARLEPLSFQEAADYLLHQVRAAGARPEAILADEAVEVLARGSRGVPRLLSQAAHQALTLACQAGASLVDVEAALEALALLGLEGEAALAAEEAGPDEAVAEPASEPVRLVEDEPKAVPLLPLPRQPA